MSPLLSKTHLQSILILLFFLSFFTPSLEVAAETLPDSASPPSATSSETAETASDETSPCLETLPPEHTRDTDQFTLMGVTCFNQKNYIAALAHYRSAYALTPNPFLLGAIGRVFQELGYPTIARDYYQDFLDNTSEPDENITRRIEEIDTQYRYSAVQFRIETEPSNAQVSFLISKDQWDTLGITPATITLPPGTYSFVLLRPGFKGENITLRVPEDIPNTRRLYYAMKPFLPDATSTPEPKKETTQISIPQPGPWQRASAYTALASFPVLVTGGILLGVGFDRAADFTNATADRSDTLFRQSRQLKIGGYVLSGIGLAGVITATVFAFLTSENKEENTTAEGPLPFPKVDLPAELPAPPFQIQYSGRF